MSLILKKDHLLLVSISSVFAVYFRLKDIGRDIVVQDEATSLLYFILPPLKKSFYCQFVEGFVGF